MRRTCVGLAESQNGEEKAGQEQNMNTSNAFYIPKTNERN